MPNLLEVIKQAAMDAQRESDPATIIYGTVVSGSPLKIQIDQKTILTSDFITLTKNVKNHELKMVIDGVEKRVTIKNGLVKGDKVAMIRQAGGQNFVVLDKM